MVTLGDRPGNGIILGKVDTNDVTSSDSDAIGWIEGEATVTNPEGYGYRLTDELVPVMKVT